MLIKSLLEKRILAEDKGDGSDGGGGAADDKTKKKDPPGEGDDEEETDEQDSKGSKKSKQRDDDGESAADPGGWTAEQKAYVESLRKESGKYRTKAKELGSKVATVENRLSKFEKGLKNLFGEEDDGKDPDEKIASLSSALQAKELDNTITELAYEHAIPKEDKEYFEYLMHKRLSSLGEDEELGEDDVAEIAKQAKAKRAGSSSSVGTGSKPDAEGGKGSGTVDLKAFQKMNITEKSALYGKNPKLYEQLMQEAKQTRRSL